MNKLLLVVISLVFNEIMLAQDISENNILKGRIIIKVKSNYKFLCKSNSIDYSAFTDLYRESGLSNLKKKFPFSNEPLKEYNSSGNKLINISLIYELKYPEKVRLNKLISDLYSIGIFEYVQPYYKNRLLYVPNDPYNLSNQYYLTNIKAYEAWDSCKGDTAIVIGIVDTGVDIDHEDLINNIAYNYNDLINGTDDDNDGFTDNYRGWDLGENDNNPQSNANHHGAHVAGTAAASTDNDKGISGTGFLTRFLPVKISDENGELTQSYEGIVYAADHGCAVINCSWGGTQWHPFGQDIINYATYNKNALVVAAAGNSDNEELIYPASYENVLSVAATNINDIKWSGSTYNYRVSLSAPGENIFFTKNDNLYGSGWGTSYASPIVAAAAAILKKEYPDFTALQLGAQLINTTDIIDTISLNSEFAHKLGTGRLNMFKAITDSILPYVRFYNITFSGSNTAYFEGNLINYLAPSVDLEVNIISLTPEIEMINNYYNFGIVNTNEPVNIRNGNFSFQLNNLSYDTKALFKFIFTDGVYEAQQYFQTVINPSYLNINYNNIKTTLTANSRLGYNSYPQKNGDGFIFKNAGNFLFEAGLILATSSSKVLDNLYDNNDFTVEQKVTELNVPDTDYKMFSAVFSDSSAADDIIGVNIYQNNYLWQSANNKDFIIFEYNIVNNNSFPVLNLYAGIYADWDIMSSDNNKAAYESDLNLSYVWNINNPIYYVGIQALNSNVIVPYAIDNVEGGNGGIDIQDGFTDAEKYYIMTHQRLSAGNNDYGNDVATMLSSGPFKINEKDTLKLSFALLAGSNLYDLKKTANNALKNYKQIILKSLDNKLMQEQLKIWPSPADKYFYLEWPLLINVRQIVLYNLTGKRIKTISGIESNIFYFEANNLKESVYILNIETDKKILQKKIIVIH